MRMMVFAAALAGAALLAVYLPAGAAGSAFSLVSRAFAPGAVIPDRHTCTGEDLSPELSWSGAPEGTRTFALVCDDPDAPVGLWVHWVVYNIPSRTTALPEGVGKGAALPTDAQEGKNSWGRTGYGGPCPPPGKPHRYFFTLYALDAPLNLLGGGTKAQVEAAMKGHVLARTELMGTFGR